MSNENNNVTFKILTFALGGISQALIMFLLYLIFQTQADVNTRLQALEKSQARLEGVVSMFDNSTPSVISKHDQNGRN